MLLSYTLPCHSRQADLVAALPSVVLAANQSPPVQIVVVDYGHKDHPLEVVLEPLRAALTDGSLDVVVYRKVPHLRMGHARNLGIRASRGEYVVIASADVCVTPNYFAVVRQRIAETGAVWLAGAERGRHLLVIQRDELINAGGFDERYEFRGPEDRDLAERLERRGGLFASYPRKMVSHLLTSQEDKGKGYGSTLSARRMYQENCRKVYWGNTHRQVLTVNDGLEWGAP